MGGGGGGGGGGGRGGEGGILSSMKIIFSLMKIFLIVFK